MESFTLLSVHLILLLFIRSSTSTDVDSITPSKSIPDGQTLVSAGGNFEAGFFSSGNSKHRYFGIWYKNISPITVVWVANREKSLNTTSGVLQLNDQGILSLVNETKGIVWSSHVSRKAMKPVAQILDSGNLIVKDTKGRLENNVLWQSFDHLCDTLLPEMKLGWNLETGLNVYLSSWKTTEDPAKGEYIVEIDFHGYPQIKQLRGDTIMTRAGSWNGIRFTGYPALKPNPLFNYEFVLNAKEVYYEYQLLDKTVYSRFVLTPLGIGQRFIWTNRTRSWELHSSGPLDQCQNYAFCGPYSSCNAQMNPPCSCLKGFVPKSSEQWTALDWSEGCVRKTSLNCNNEDGFLQHTEIKLPDTTSSWYDKSINLMGCKNLCLRNCSCTAYASLDIRGGGTGCLLWFDELVDMTEFSDGGQDIYVKVAARDLGKQNFSWKTIIGVAIGASVFVFGVGMAIYKYEKQDGSGITKVFCWKYQKKKQNKEDMDLPTFDLATVIKATSNFSSSTKLGEGGFGPVHKGTLKDGQELAIKRLSTNSGQGLKEFKNEVMLITKLQHRNLVKLLGCCIEDDEKILIYEYMRNKSLDHFLFDESRSKQLGWHNRLEIIGGIARGLLYLHQDSRLRIIHRDLKASNILLDTNMTPKISDFGMASTFWGDQVEANTNRVAGTYGYMPPEYAVHGQFSVKSDVFSFGVIVLEIVSGQKNRGFCRPHHNLNLLGYAWKLWMDGRPLELMDESLGDTCIESEVLRCIHVGLLCVQHVPEDRPNMSSVVLMLNGEKMLPTPKHPGFYGGNDISVAACSSRTHERYNSSSRKCELSISSEITITTLDPR